MTRIGPQAPGPRSAAPPQHRSEATRLLCAGVWFDAGFRRRVIEELVEHEERPIAPSLGMDAVPVLAHALRARRRETGTGVQLLFLWAVFVLLGILDIGADRVRVVPWYLAYALVCVVCRVVRASGGAVFALRRGEIREATRGRLKAVLPVVPFVATAAYWALVAEALIDGADVWTAVLLPLLLMLPVAAHRAEVVSVMGRSLSRDAWAGAARRPELPGSQRYRRIGAAIDREQYAPVAVYDPFRPFVGAGTPYQPWSFAVELKRSGAGPGGLTAREVIDLVKPRLEALKASAEATSHDRLRDLEVEEVVYLPVGPDREDVDYGPREVRDQLDSAVGEGGEDRRHFLRVRLGAWHEQVGICLLVRVHTQGGMLVLEVVPHVLGPVRPEFGSADVIADRADPVRDAVLAFLTSPAANCAAVLSVIRTVVSGCRLWLAPPQFAAPDAPVRSVRELGSTQDVSLFQEMDISRYVKTLQDRITSGVQDALSAKGYETGAFEQYVISVAEGGVFIGSMSGGAVAAGDRASAKHTEGTAQAGGGRA